MLGSFIFDFLQTESSGRQVRVAVVYLMTEVASERHLRLALKDYFRQAPPPDKLILLGLDEYRQVANFEEILKSKDFPRHLADETRYTRPPQLGALVMNAHGELREVGSQEGGRNSVDMVRQKGLLRVFRRRGGILEATNSHHYVKPSGKHSDRFIRTANILVSGAEVSFIAYWILPYINNGIKHIYTDTAAIHSVALLLVSQRRRLIPGYPIPTVDSFGSYRGVIDKQFLFEGLPQSLVIVSASTSGDLEKELRTRYSIGLHQMVTLFYLGTPPEGQQTLCVLQKSDEYPEGYEPFENYTSAEVCELCKAGSIPVSIIGDQFIPESPRVSAELIRQEDCSKELFRFLDLFVGKRVIRCNFRNREFYLDLSTVFESTGGSPSHDKFLKAIDRKLLQVTPASLKRIIYLSNPTSKALADRVQRIYTSAGGNDGALIIKSSEEIDASLESNVMNSGTTLVVAGTMTSGRRLMAMSQSLRKIQANHSLQYVVGVARTQTLDQYDEVRSNLQFGEHGPRTYEFHCLSRLFLPNDPLRYSIWLQERAFLRRILDRPSDSPQLEERMQSRIDHIDDRVNDEKPYIGLVENLFWPGMRTGPLKIAHGFVFWESIAMEGRGPSQADVYFTVAAVLHDWRRRLGGFVFGSHQESRRVVLAPQCFYRFNDGVVQAALLRAADPMELDYRLSTPHSEAMRDVLAFVFANIENIHGEAAYEFLLALAMSRLRLQTIHTREVVEKLKANHAMGCCVIEFLSQLILSTLES